MALALTGLAIATLLWASSNDIARSSESDIEGPKDGPCDELLDQIRSGPDPSKSASERGFPSLVLVPASTDVGRVLCWDTVSMTDGRGKIHAIAVENADQTESWFVRTTYPLDSMDDEDWLSTLIDNGFAMQSAESTNWGFASDALDPTQGTTVLWAKLHDD